MVEVVLYYNHSRGVDQRPRKALRDLLNALSCRRGRDWRSNRGKSGVMGSTPILDKRLPSATLLSPSVPHGGEIPPTLPR